MYHTRNISKKHNAPGLNLEDEALDEWLEHLARYIERADKRYKKSIRQKRNQPGYSSLTY